MSPAPPRPTTATNLLTSAGTLEGYHEWLLHPELLFQLEWLLQLDWLLQLEWLLHSRNDLCLNLLPALYMHMHPLQHMAQRQRNVKIQKQEYLTFARLVTRRHLTPIV